MDRIVWTPWASLGRPVGGDLERTVAQRNQDGRVEVFGLVGGRIFNTAQTAPNAVFRIDWRDKERPLETDLVAHLVGRNADGRQEIFAAGGDGRVWQKWQLAPN